MVGLLSLTYLARLISKLLPYADVWVELNKAWILYSRPYEEAMRVGKVRYLCLVGMDADMMVRNVGRVNIPVLYEFQRRLARITKNLRHFKLTTPAGTDLEFENDPQRPVLVEGLNQRPFKGSLRPAPSHTDGMLKPDINR